MEDFLKGLRKIHNIVPDVITQDNVNICFDGVPGLDMLFYAVYYKHLDIIQELVLSGARIGECHLLKACDDINVLRVLLRTGGNPSCLGGIVFQKLPICALLLDYGGFLSPYWINNGCPQEIIDYNQRVSFRISSSRKTLAALMICCKGGPFRAQRDVIHTIAKEMWCMKGPEGCGPRAYEWE